MNLSLSLGQLLTHEAVFRWDTSIMEGILDMTELLMELIAERLKQPPIPLILLHLLATVRHPCRSLTGVSCSVPILQVWSADNNFHTKMRSKRADTARWEKLFGKNGQFAQMPSYQMQKVCKYLLY